MDNKLSIITICYNDCNGLRRTIETVLNQSARSHFQYIVIDGGSTDGSKDVLKEFSPQINYSISEKDTGIYNAMNKGVNHATGDYCLFLNSGDYLRDNTVIERILECLGKEDIIIGMTVFSNSGKLFTAPEFLTLNHFYNHSIPHQASFIKTSLLRKYPYDESYRIVSDWKFFIQTLIIDNASYKIIDEIIADYNTDGISSTNRDLCYIERKDVLSHLFPERVLLDYLQFNNGSGYKETLYDRFYIKLRDYKYGKVLYSMNVRLMKCISIFKKGARFSRLFPNKIS